MAVLAAGHQSSGVPAGELNVLIVDGYVDEPAHFGVPPYLSTYPRYTAGAVVDAGVPRPQVDYLTIDALRHDNTNWRDVEAADLVIYIGGMTVPGNYVGGTPAEPDEVRELAWTATGTTLLGGPVRFGVGERNMGASDMHRDSLDYDFVAKGDVEAATYDLITNGLEGFGDRMRDNDELAHWATKGSFIVEHHPNHPTYLICELETSRGCPYRCSFCTEPLYGATPSFRDPESIITEVAELYRYGVTHFRIGRQADILAYGGNGKTPNPAALKELYTGIRDVAPGIETLHLDNMNPITIVNWPTQAREGIRIIATHNTPGDTAAFGLESADPVVQEENNLNVTAQECFEAIEIVNEIGGHRPNERGLPKLLPGINLVHGLKGEREATYEHNKQFLQRVYESGLMVRRINIRQVMAFPGTGMSDTGASVAKQRTKPFNKYKQEIREAIDQPMLKRVAPQGTILNDVHLEYQKDGKTFGRQIGTYPLLVGIPGERTLGSLLDVWIVDHGYRSVTGVPYPLDINTASMDELLAVPGLGSSRAGNIIVNRPYQSMAEIDSSLTVDSSLFTIQANHEPAK